MLFANHDITFVLTRRILITHHHLPISAITKHNRVTIQSNACNIRINTLILSNKEVCKFHN